MIHITLIRIFYRQIASANFMRPNPADPIIAKAETDI